MQANEADLVAAASHAGEDDILGALTRDRFFFR